MLTDVIFAVVSSWLVVNPLQFSTFNRIPPPCCLAQVIVSLVDSDGLAEYKAALSEVITKSKRIARSRTLAVDDGDDDEFDRASVSSFNTDPSQVALRTSAQRMKGVDF